MTDPDYDTGTLLIKRQGYRKYFKSRKMKLKTRILVLE